MRKGFSIGCGCQTRSEKRIIFVSLILILLVDVIQGRLVSYKFMQISLFIPEQVRAIKINVFNSSCNVKLFILMRVLLLKRLHIISVIECVREGLFILNSGFISNRTHILFLWNKQYIALIDIDGRKVVCKNPDQNSKFHDYSQ